MNYLYLRVFLLIIIISLSLPAISVAQASYKSGSKNPEKALFGRTGGKTRKIKVKEPRAIGKAKRKQEKNEKRLKKESAEFVKQSRQRSYDIQSPEVQARMKQNEKDTVIKDKEKKKKARQSTSKAAKKYN